MDIFVRLFWVFRLDEIHVHEPVLKSEVFRDKGTGLSDP